MQWNAIHFVYTEEQIYYNTLLRLSNGASGMIIKKSRDLNNAPAI